MSLFSKTPDVPPPNGVDVLRARLKAWSGKPGAINAVVRDVEGLGLAKLQDFIEGRFTPSIEVLQQLTKAAFSGYAILDGQTLMLRSAYEDQPQRSFTPPDPFQPEAKQMPRYERGPQPAKPKRVATTTKRDGWAGEFFRTKVEPPAVREKQRERFVRLREV
ncbi:hypothetical protein [Bradyrhizobium sp. 604_D8_N2_3]|uniref:hypothetical protein n=1 Tax=Bradyrhizobium sp. 604_D8_N2_3 TaxID=3240370 RepID=UPI003F234233